MSSERPDPTRWVIPAPARLLTIEAIPRRSSITLCCAGEVDFHNVECLEEALSHAIRGDFPLVEIDLEQVQQGDGSAIEALRHATAELARDGRELRIWNGDLDA